MAASKTNRRGFFRRGVTAAVATATAPLVVRSTALGRGRAAPSDRITVGFIGVGWKGLQGCWGSLVHSFLANPACQKVAACDVNRQSCDKEERKQARMTDECHRVGTIA